MPAQIRSSIAAKPTVDNASRDDLTPGDVITLEVVPPVVGTTFQWTLVFVPAGSTATLTPAAAAATAGPVTFTADIVGPYLVRLTVDAGLPTEDTQYVRLRALTASLGLKLVAAGERRDSTGVIPVDASSEGWANDQNANLLALEAAIAGSTAPLASVLGVGNTTGGTDIEITSGDSIVGQAGTGVGGDVPLIGGTPTSGNAHGGTVILRPGEGSGTGDDGTIAFVSPDGANVIRAGVTGAGEITFGVGAANPMVYNTATGKLTVPGLIDPTGMVFDFAPKPATGAGKGAVFVSDGSGGLSADTLYYADSTGATTDLLAGGGGGFSIQRVDVTFDLDQNPSDTGVVTSDSYGPSSARVPSGTPFFMNFPTYLTFNDGLTDSCAPGGFNSADRSDDLWWEDAVLPLPFSVPFLPIVPFTTTVWIPDNSVAVPNDPSDPPKVRPAAGLASTGSLGQVAWQTEIAPDGSSRVGRYFEIEAITDLPESFRAGFFNATFLSDPGETEPCIRQIVGGPSPNNLLGEGAGSLPDPTMALQNDNTVYTGASSPDPQWRDSTAGPLLTAGDRIGVLLEYADFADSGLGPPFDDPSGELYPNNFKIRAYFYHHPTGTWLNSADPTTGDGGAIYFSGNFAKGIVEFGPNDGSPDDVSVGDTFTITDGFGTTRTYEWVAGAPSSSTEITLPAAPATGEDVRDAAAAAVEADAGYPPGTGPGGLKVLVLAPTGSNAMQVNAPVVGTDFNGDLAEGTLTCVDAAATPNAGTFVIEDGFGNTVTFTWYDTSVGGPPPAVPVSYDSTSGDTADDIRDLVLAAVQGQIAAGNLRVNVEAGSGLGELDVVALSPGPDFDGSGPTSATAPVTANPFSGGGYGPVAASTSNPGAIAVTPYNGSGSSADRGRGADVAEMLPAVGISTDIRASVDLNLTGASTGDFLVFANASSVVTSLPTPNYEYFGVGCWYEAEIKIDAGLSGAAGDQVEVQIPAGGGISLTMTSETTGTPGPDEFTAVAGDPATTASNLASAINDPGNSWASPGSGAIGYRAEIDPKDSSLVVIKPNGPGPVTAAQTQLLYGRDELSSLAVNVNTGGTFDTGATQRVNRYDTSGPGSGFSDFVDPTCRLGEDGDKGYQVTYYLDRVDTAAYTGRLYAYPPGSDGNNISVAAYLGDGSGNSFGLTKNSSGAWTSFTGFLSYTKGEDFPNLTVITNPDGWSITPVDLPVWAQPWGGGSGVGSAIPIDTGFVFNAFGGNPFPVDWVAGGVLPFNSSGVGRSANVILDRVYTDPGDPDIEIEYVRSDFPYPTSVQTLTISGPLVDETRIESIHVPIGEITAVRANIKSGTLKVVFGDLWTPYNAPVGLSSGVPTPAPILPSPAPTIVVTDQAGRSYSFTPDIGGDDGNMLDLYGAVAPTLLTVPSKNTQRVPVLATAHFRVEDT